MIEKAKPLTGWTEGFFKSFDGAGLFYRVFEPAKVRHTLVILHGYGEHTGRYLKFSEKLKGVPVRLALFDCRGSGNSLAGLAEPRSVGEYQKDLGAFIDFLKSKYNSKDKIILMGHSLGGLVSLQWAFENPAAIKRLILSVPFLGLPGLPVLRGLNAIIKLLLPAHIYHNPVLPKNLSHDIREVALYQKDPMIRRSISAQFIGSILDIIVRLRKKETVTIPFPVHILVAGHDRIVDSKASRRFFERLVSPKKELTEFEGFYHEIFNEEGQNRAFNVLKTILEECV